MLIFVSQSFCADSTLPVCNVRMRPARHTCARRGKSAEANGIDSSFTSPVTSLSLATRAVCWRDSRPVMGGYGIWVRAAASAAISSKTGGNTHFISDAGSMILCAIAILVSVGLLLLSEKKKAAVGRRYVSVIICSGPGSPSCPETNGMYVGKCR